MNPFVVLCILQFGSGYFYGIAHTEYFLVPSESYCHRTAETNNVYPFDVTTEVLYLSSQKDTRRLFEACGPKLKDCHEAAATMESIK